MRNLKGSPFTNCYRCGRKCLRSAPACPECGCVAFINGLKPSWPPTYYYTCDGQPHCRYVEKHAVSPGAFLLGPIPQSLTAIGMEPLRKNKGGKV